MWINRNLSSVVEQAVSSRPCVLLSGARQTGKSSLLNKLYPNYNYVSLDVPLIAKQATSNSLEFIASQKHPIIIDEIQHAPELFKALKIVIDQDRQQFGRFVLTGSQQFALMQGVTESLAGRISVINLNSLSVKELANHYGLVASTQQSLEWIIKGGYPEIYQQNLNNEQFFNDYISTYIERDVRQLLNIKDAYQFNQFLRLLALCSGQVLSMNRIAVDIGVSMPTIKSWVSVLEASGIIYLLKPWFRNYGKRITKSPKIYFLDTGLLCYLANINSVENLSSSPLLGNFHETLAFGELYRSKQLQSSNNSIYYYRDVQGLEVDFVIPEGEKLHLYECKWQDQSGTIPTNIHKAIKLFGIDDVHSINTITNVANKVKIDDKFSVLNLLEL